tara:strand:+ start:1478 stop:1777 length:300 start_codon:yes stop_codon:yes gene_type:complete
MKELETYGEMRLNTLDVGRYKAEWEDEFGFLYTATVTVKRKERVGLYRDRDWLDDAYSKQGMSMQTIADMFGISPTAVHKWLRKFDIPTRQRGRVKNDS